MGSKDSYYTRECLTGALFSRIQLLPGIQAYLQEAKALKACIVFSEMLPRLTVRWSSFIPTRALQQPSIHLSASGRS